MLSLLVTDAIARQYAHDIRRTVGTTPCELIVLDASGDALPEGLARAELSFLSTDLMGGSNKQHPNARLRAFARAIEGAGSLRWLHTCASGADRDILQHAMRRGVRVTTSSGANALAVAHTAIAGMLALARGVPQWVEGQARCAWNVRAAVDARPRDLDGSHALVIGTGPIGQAIARICGAMGLRVSGVRRNATESVPGFDRTLGFEQVDSVLPTVDWLFLACPLTPRTRGLVDAGLLARLPAHACLVNVSRGEVVVEGALHDALRAGRLGGCYSDVFVEEPLPHDSPWWQMPRTLISPHLGGLAAGFAGRTVEAFLDNLGRYVRGEPLRNLAVPAGT